MDEDKGSPEHNYRKNRGLIIGPMIGMLVGVAVGFFSNAPTGTVAAGCIGVGLVVGALLDALQRRGQRNRPTPPK